MIISGHEAFLLTLLFGVTGYITHSVATRFTFRRSERPELLLLRFLAYGTMNALISLPIIALHTRLLPRETWATILTQNLFAYYGLTFWVLFLIPTTLGGIFGILHFLYGLQDWYRVPVATWGELVFRSRGQWVLVNLEGGTKAVGFLGREAAVVSDTGDNDLYLQTLYRADVDGNWEKVPRTRGMLISGRTIQNIEFWENENLRSTTPLDRLKSWAFPRNGHLPPDFRSSLILSVSEPD